MIEVQEWDRTTTDYWDEISQALDQANNGDHASAEAGFRDLAGRGSVYAMVQIAWMIEEGEADRGVEAAEEFYDQAAQSGNLWAQFYTAKFYLRRDEPETAFYWARESADEGYVPSIYLMGKLYRAGLGCEANLDYYREYNEFAAKEGNIWAKRRLYVDMIGGKYGMSHVGIGLFKFVGLIPVVFVLGWRTPDAPELLG